MARDHARMLTSMWDDPDFTALSCAEIVTYWSLAASRDLSWCGVAPLLPQRLASNARDLSVAKARAHLAALQRQRFIVIDDTTAEVCVRTYVRHDGIINQPNVVKAMVRALDQVRSPSIIETIKDELARLMGERPDAKGWQTILAIAPELFGDLNARAMTNPKGKGSPNPMPEGFREGMPNYPSPFPLPPTPRASGHLGMASSPSKREARPTHAMPGAPR